jgi:hypothetical protein
MKQGSRSFFKYTSGFGGIALYLFTYVCAVGIVGLFYLAFYTLAFDYSSLATFLCIVGALALFYSLPALRKMSRRLRTKVITDLASFLDYMHRHDRNLILYLREFEADESPSPFAVSDGRDENYTSDEDLLINKIKKYGDLLAIGKPGERLTSVGDYRLYIDGKDWQSVVSDLLQKADAIILRCGVSEALHWEIDKITNLNLIEHTVFINSDLSSRIALEQHLGDLGFITTVIGQRDKTLKNNSFKKIMLEEGHIFEYDQLLENLAVVEQQYTDFKLLSGPSVFVIQDKVIKDLYEDFKLSIPMAMEAIGISIQNEFHWDFERIVKLISDICSRLAIALFAVGLPLFVLHSFGFGRGWLVDRSMTESILMTAFVLFLFSRSL